MTEPIKELLPCPECGYEKLHKRTTKTTVCMPVSIRCSLCDLTIEMQNWDSLIKFWNKLSRGHPPSEPLSKIDERELDDFFMGYTGDMAKAVNIRQRFFSKFGTPSEPERVMSLLEIQKLVDKNAQPFYEAGPLGETHTIKFEEFCQALYDSQLKHHSGEK